MQTITEFSPTNNNNQLLTRISLLEKEVAKIKILVVKKTVDITTSFLNLPAFGIWKDRKDVKNSLEFEKKIRSGWTKRLRRTNIA